MYRKYIQEKHEITIDDLKNHYGNDTRDKMISIIKNAIRLTIYSKNDTPDSMAIISELYKMYKNDPDIISSMVDMYGISFSYNPDLFLRLCAVLDLVYHNVLKELLCGLDDNTFVHSIEYIVLEEILKFKNNILKDDILLSSDKVDKHSFMAMLYKNPNGLKYLESLANDITIETTNEIVTDVIDIICLYILSVIVIENENPTPMMKLSNVELRQNRIIRFDNNILTVTSV